MSDITIPVAQSRAAALVNDPEKLDFIQKSLTFLANADYVSVCLFAAKATETASGVAISSHGLYYKPDASLWVTLATRALDELAANGDVETSRKAKRVLTLFVKLFDLKSHSHTNLKDIGKVN